MRDLSSGDRYLSPIAELRCSLERNDRGRIPIVRAPEFVKPHSARIVIRSSLETPRVDQPRCPLRSDGNRVQGIPVGRQRNRRMNLERWQFRGGKCKLEEIEEHFRPTRTIVSECDGVRT